MKYYKSIPRFLLILTVAVPSFGWAAPEKEEKEKNVRAKEKLTSVQPLPAQKITSVSSNSVELSDYIVMVAKKLKTKFIVDPSVRGRISVIAPDQLSNEELRNALMLSLMVNQFSIVELNGFEVIVPARNAPKSGIPIVQDAMSVKEEKMITWVHRLKHTTVGEFSKYLGRMVSRDGTLDPYDPSNFLIVSDFTSSVQRIQKLVDAVDIPSK